MEEKYDSEGMQYLLEYELLDELRGAFIQGIVKLLIATGIFFFVFLQDGMLLRIVGAVLLGIVVFGVLPSIQVYFRFIARRRF